MDIRHPFQGLPARIALATAGLLGIFAVAGRSLAPGMSTLEWLLWCLGVGAAIAAVALVVLVAKLQFAQWVLRMGGTDTRWLWFNNEPKGLVRLRAAQRKQAGQ